MNLIRPILLIVGVSLSCDCYRILAIFPLNAKSHNIFFDSVMLSLLNKGHQIDAMTHFPMKDAPKNYRTIVNFDGHALQIMNNVTFDFVKLLFNDFHQSMFTTFGNDICELLGLPELQKTIRNPPQDPPYDLLITETFAANCFAGIGRLLKVPVIAVHSSYEYPWIAEVIGNYDNLAVVPNVYRHTTIQRKFWDRVMNVLTYYESIYIYHTMTGAEQTRLMQKYLSPEIPHIREVEKDYALTFLNSHWSIFGSKPTSPSVVELGGLHIEFNKDELTPELKKWLDESTHGVVYFTLGSLILIETLPPKIISIFYEVFNKIKPRRVLMKIVDEDRLPPGLPDNVLIMQWIPQIPVLGHKNTKLFLCHGGLLGSEEALYFGVPMIGFPLIADQMRNTGAFVHKNMSVILMLEDMTEESLSSTVLEVLNNPKYREAAKYYSKIFRDRPMNAKDTVVYWAEYVIRNGPNILRSPALHFTWWQVALLDIYGFILLSVVFIISICLLLTKLIYGRLKQYCKIYYSLNKKIE